MSWGFAIYAYPFAIGLGYRMPLDFSLSLWFFLLTWKLPPVVLTTLGFATAVGLLNEHVRCMDWYWRNRAMDEPQAHHEYHRKGVCQENG